MPKHILIIEDEENLVELIKFRLEISGYKVSTAFDGQDGLKKIRDLVPDLIVLDIMMPKLTGYDILKMIKQDKETAEIPVLVLTARVQKSDRETASEYGADSFMEKPFEPKNFLDEIKRLLKEGKK